MSHVGRVLSGIYELPAPRRIVPFEGLRGLAVLLVFFVHYRAAFLPLFQPGEGTTAASHVLWSIGHSGVDLFFLLSGYLIYGGLIAKPTGYWGYLKRRIERIYPTFLAVLALYLMLSLALPSHSKLPGGAWDAGVYIVQNVLLLPGIFAIEPIVTVAWSLSYEFSFYLLVPLVVWLFGLRARSGGRRALLFAGMTVCACIAYMVFGRHLQAVMFIAGVLVFEATQRPWPVTTVRRAERAAVLVLLAAITLLYTIEIRAGMMRDLFAGSTHLVQIVRTASLFIGFGLLVFACLTPGTRSGALFSWTPIRWLGNMSYSYYLIHGLTINATAMVLGYLIDPPGGIAAAVLYWLTIVIAFAATLVSSTLLFVAVERPLSLRSKSAKPRVVEAGGAGLGNLQASEVA